MPINPIRHFALTNWPTVHDEEALSALELQGRTAAKLNECVHVINQQIDLINAELDKLEGYAVEAVDDSIRDGRISARLAGLIWENLNTSYKELNDRLNALILAANPVDNAEVLDARGDFDTLGDHVRAMNTGRAWGDAVRPGTVRAGRIMAGMTGGDLRDKFTIREVVSMAGHWNGSQGYHDAETLGFVSHSGYKMTDLIPCEYGETFILESYLFGPLVRPAVLFDSTKKPIAVLGEPGKSSWDMMNDEVHIGMGNAAYIAFVCGGSYLNNFRAYRVSMKEAFDRDVYGAGKGYLHARAKKRTDTITDRAQIKVWFKLPADHSSDRIYTVPAQLLRYMNLESWTFRIFGATSNKTYDMQLATSAAAYKYSTSNGIRAYFTVPNETGGGIPITHVCMLVDLIPARPDEFMNVYLCPMKMEWRGGYADGEGYALHGHLESDTLNTVWPGAASSPLYNKRILGVGDSLMSGNTLRKEVTWFNIAAGTRDMVLHNAAVNGRPVAGSDSMESHIGGILSEFNKPDYAIIQGGANDLRLNVSISAFRQGLQNIVSAIRENNPMCKILFVTNWRRSDYINAQGFDEDDYVSAMMEEAESLHIPCVNSYTTALDLRDPAIAAWADEGIVSGGDANIHFSLAANEYIAPSIIKALEGI